MLIANHTFLISGGSSGLGAACARHLVGLGGNVVIADLNAAAGAQIASELGAMAAFEKCNVSSADDVQRAIDLALERFGALHGAICCAGILGAARVAGREGPHDLDLFRRVIDVNLIGTFNVARLAAAAMLRHSPNEQGERGVMVFTASVAAFEGQIGQAAYSASKGGVLAMALPIARDLMNDGVRVNTILPGVFKTPMVAMMPPNVQEALGAQVPFPKRLGKAEEYAELAAFIVETPYLNAESIRLDGGIRMAPR
jgi:3-hydroxyacyl-CoA dehydrogenase / 3-hydroxy-2-methylbutyryl-CoA dehydrogenase